MNELELNLEKARPRPEKQRPDVLDNGSGNKFGLEKARRLTKNNGAVTHLAENEDGTFSVHVHSKKVACGNCGGQGDCNKVDNPKPVTIRPEKGRLKRR